MDNLIFLKLGGSLITDKSKPYTLRPEVIARLCREIHEARQTRPIALVVGHGGGSFPHVSAKQYQTQQGIINDKSWQGFARVQDDAAKLNRIVVAALLAVGDAAVSLQPSASCLAENGRIADWPLRNMEILLRHGLIPVPYGDVCLDTAKGCCIISTEEILSFLGKKMRPQRILMAGKTDGVLDQEGKTIPRISRDNFGDIRRLLQASDGVADVTGGMLLKVQKSLDFGIETEIVNGMKPDLLKRALLGERGIGTVIHG
jgi:isopentenyl phosphate kinase